MQFVQERIEKTEDKTDYLRLLEVFNDFKSWYTENHPSYAKEKIGKGTFKSEMNKRLEVIGANSRWIGYKFIIDTDEEGTDVNQSATEEEADTFNLD